MSVVINPTVATVGRTVTARYFGTGDGSRVAFNLAGLDSDRAYLMPVLYGQALAYTIITEGDSITAAINRWPYLISPNKFINHAVAGDTTSTMVTRYDTYKTSPGTHFAVLGGVNDIVTSVPIATIKANLLYMWSDAASRGVRVIAMTNTPWEGYSSWDAGKQTVTEALNVWIRTTAASLGYVLVDTYVVLQDPVNPTKLLAAYDSGDHLHPSDAGSLAIAQAVAAAAALPLTGWWGVQSLTSTTRTNLLKWSQNYEAVGWGKSHAGTGVDPVITPNNAIGPDGTMSASTIVFDTGASETFSDYSILTGGSATTVNATVYETWVWIKGTAGEKIQMRGVNGSGYTIFTFSGLWEKIGLSSTSFNTNGLLELGCRQKSDSVTIMTHPLTIQLWHAQIELGVAMTDAIFTNTAPVTVYSSSTDTTGKTTVSTAPLNGMIVSYKDPFAPSGNVYRAFGMGDGTSTDFSLPFVPKVPVLYRTDWQGKQTLYSTARTNLLTNAAFANTGGAAPTSWTQIVGTGVSAPSVSSLDGGVAYSQSAAAQRPFIAQTSPTLSANTTYAYSVIIESISGGLTATDIILGGAAPPAGSTVTYPVCAANPSGGSGGVVTTGVLLVTISVAATPGTVSLRLGIGCSGAVTGVVIFSHPQLELGSARTSWISTGAPTTVTDYTYTPAGDVTLAVAPVTGALLTGDFNMGPTP